MAAPRNILTHPPRLPLIAPSILSADFANLADDCRHILSPPDAPTDHHADLLHVDVMDGHFVPNLTMGPALVAALHRAIPDAFLDVHVMVTDPIQYVRPFADAGANHLTFHIEPALDTTAGSGMAPRSEGYDPIELASAIHDAGMTVGLAINPPTPLSDHILELAPAFDLILVMSVNPGFSGQDFIPESLDKTRALRAHLGPDVRIQMDGGITPSNAPAVRDAGCDVIVAASAIFGQKTAIRPQIVDALRH